MAKNVIFQSFTDQETLSNLQQFTEANSTKSGLSVAEKMVMSMSITIAKFFFSTALDGVCLLHIYSSPCDSVNSGDGVYNSQTASGFCRTSHLGGRGSQIQSTGRENDESLYSDVFTQV